MKHNCGLLVVSFGTSYEATRKATLEAIERELQMAFPTRAFYRAWTSPRILKKIRQTQGLCYDTVAQALERMLRDGVEDLLVQPTHMLAGAEYTALAATLGDYRPRFHRLALGKPLLAGPEDIPPLASALEEIFSSVPREEMLALMGHGSAREPFPTYVALDRQFKADGYPNFAVGTVEFAPGIDPVLRQAREQKPRRIYLAPLLVVAGDHALNDMAGEAPDSWRNQLAGEGAEVISILRGLGEYPAIRALYVARAKQAGPLE